MNKTFRFICVLFAFILMLSALGCDTKPANPLVGKWIYKEDDAEYLWDFKADGNLLLNYVNAKFDAKYTIVDEDSFTVKITVGEDTETMEFDYKINGDTLTLTIEGSSQEFKRGK